MDFPTSKAGALRLSGGRYIDRDEGTSTPGSIITAADFINPTIDELLAVIAEGGIAPDEATFTQLRDAIKNIIAANPSVPRGYIDGLTLSNNGADANNDIDIAAGIARDGGDAANMVLAATLTKQLDAAWAVGSNAGGLDTGAKAADSWYHVWLIRRSDTGVVDALFSLSATNPTMPADYDQKRRIGAVLTDGSGNIIAFTQHGDEFTWDDPVQEFNGNPPATTGQTLALSVPTGINTLVHVSFSLDNGAAAGFLLVFSGGQNTPSPTSSYHHLKTSNGTYDSSEFVRKTDTSGQIQYRSNATTVTLTVLCQGWIDPRGKNA